MDTGFVTRGRVHCQTENERKKREIRGRVVRLGGNNQLERKGEGVSVYT